jgi:multiple sugar transport system substrate-binding protein
MLFKYSKFPNAAKAYLAFMMEKEQYEPWQQAAIGYVSHPLKAYEKNPLWGSDPKNLPYSDSMKVMLPNGFAGPMGYASAACMADFIMVNMVAEASPDRRPVKEAMDRAQGQGERYYKV